MSLPVGCRSSAGLTLTELMMALVITSLLASAVIQAYLTTVKQYAWLHQRLDERQGLQKVADLMVQSIQRAGFGGCLGQSDYRQNRTKAAFLGLSLLDPNDKALPLPISRSVIAGSKVLAVGYMDPSQMAMVGSLQGYRLSLIRVPEMRWQSGQTVVIGNCFHLAFADIQSKTSDRQFWLSQLISNTLKPPIFVAPLVNQYFYLRGNGKQRGLYLYQQGRSEALMQGIATLDLRREKQAIIYRLQATHSALQGQCLIHNAYG